MPDWNTIYASKNSEGYHDPTAKGAFDRIDRETAGEDKLRRTISALKTVADLAGYNIINRIELLDKETGRVYR